MKFSALLSVILLLIIAQGSMVRAASNATGDGIDVDKLAVVTTAHKSGAAAQGKFYYDNESGKLFVKRESTRLEEVVSFGPIRGLNGFDLQILAYAPGSVQNATKPEILVIRHGYWVSVLDLKQEGPLVANLGPFSAPVGGEAYNRILPGVDGMPAMATFIGEAWVKTAAADSEAIRIFNVVNLRNGMVGWLPVRRDQNPVDSPNPPELELLQESVIDFKAYFNEVFVEKSGSQGMRYGERPTLAQMMVDLNSGNIEMVPGASFFQNGSITRNRTLTKQFQGMKHPDAFVGRFYIKGVALGELLGSGNPHDSRPRDAAEQVARRRISEANRFGQRAKESLKDLQGQPGVVDSLVKIAKAQPMASKVSVVLLAGPTGVGKTSSVHLLERSLNPDADQPVFRISFAEQQEKEFLQTELFGSAPGYVGSYTPTALMVWAMEHADGGAVLFDEIDKAPTEALGVLLNFLEKPVVVLKPHLVAAMVESYTKRETPVSKWPRILREKTKEGKEPNVTIEVELIPGRHRIYLGTNAGEEFFNGSGNSNVSGRRLSREDEIARANRLFNEEKVKDALRNRGFTDPQINRITDIIPYHALLPADIATIAGRRMDEILSKFEKEFMVKFELTAGAREYFASEVYLPLEGARNVANQLERWLNQNLNSTVVDDEPVVRPGQHVVIDIEKGSTAKKSTMVLKNVETSSEVARFEVGKPLPPNPKELLERLRRDLYPTLKRRIVGHEEELKAINDQILSQVYKVANDPAADGLVILLNLEGFSGNGKTEIAKAIFEAITGSRDGLMSSEMNTIHSLDQFYRSVLGRWTGAIRTNPEYFFWLLDELPRAGEGNSAVKAAIQNELMSVLDERKIPPMPGETRYVNGKPVAVTEVTKLPAISVIIATGNVMTRTLGARQERMNNRELRAHFNYIKKHPEVYYHEYEKEYETAFRSRAGDPILIAPLSDGEINILKERFLDSSTKLAAKNGISVKLTESIEGFFDKFYVPVRGGRWIRAALGKYIEAPINTMVATQSEGFYKDSTFEIYFVEKTKEIRAKILREGKLIADEKLAQVPTTKTEYHETVLEKEAWNTSVHEAGHAIVRAALYGADSVEEMNTFGEGGWMLPATDVPTQNLYQTAKKGPYSIAVSLGGHHAEEMFLPEGPTNGASSDYQKARSVAQTMLTDGSVLGMAPLPLITNPSTGQIDMSEETKAKLEVRMAALMGGSGRLTREILERNRALVIELAKAAMDDPNMSLNREAITKILKGRIWMPKDAEVRAILTRDDDEKVKELCEQMLVNGSAKITKTVQKLGWWKRFVRWLWN